MSFRLCRSFSECIFIALMYFSMHSLQFYTNLQFFCLCNTVIFSSGKLFCHATLRAVFGILYFSIYSCRYAKLGTYGTVYNYILKLNMHNTHILPSLPLSLSCICICIKYGMLSITNVACPCKTNLLSVMSTTRTQKTKPRYEEIRKKRIIIRESKRRTKGGRVCDVLRMKMQKGGEAEDEARRRIGSFGNGEAAELAPNCECCGWLVPSSGLSLERD